jgi:hypothetical protein
MVLVHAFGFCLLQAAQAACRAIALPRIRQMARAWKTLACSAVKSVLIVISNNHFSTIPNFYG